MRGEGNGREAVGGKDGVVQQGAREATVKSNILRRQHPRTCPCQVKDS